MCAGMCVVEVVVVGRCRRLSPTLTPHTHTHTYIHTHTRMQVYKIFPELGEALDNLIANRHFWQVCACACVRAYCLGW